MSFRDSRGESASTTGFGSDGGNADLFRGVEALKNFKTRIDTVLTDFEASAGGSGKVGQHLLARASFSGADIPFPEADDLHSAYNQVHERLTSLSRMLGDQIEAMGIAVQGADIGFDNLDEEMRRRFHTIQTRTYEDRELYGPDREREHTVAPGQETRDGATEGGYA
ncbi:hypothetical protein HUT18_27095 [Streptomyces sp. NA04227]|nr:hypothetical protein HUT18_27095 [Streptomyces sp. NA04227]